MNFIANKIVVLLILVYNNSVLINNLGQNQSIIINGCRIMSVNYTYNLQCI